MKYILSILLLSGCSDLFNNNNEAYQIHRAVGCKKAVLKLYDMKVFTSLSKEQKKEIIDYCETVKMSVED